MELIGQQFKNWCKDLQKKKIKSCTELFNFPSKKI